MTDAPRRPDPTTVLRRGDHADLDLLLAWFDEAVAWMVERGQPEQWGTRPWSTDLARVDRVRELLDAGELWIAELDGGPAGALIIGDRPAAYVPAVAEPERYVHLLITSRAVAGRGVGSVLLAKARDRAAADGVALLRVDCWAGAGGSLVEYYVRNGFTPNGTFDINGWSGQVLELELPSG